MFLPISMSLIIRPGLLVGLVCHISTYIHVINNHTRSPYAMFQVFYIDFGNVEWVAERDVNKIEPRFIHLPFQAVECFLPLDPVDVKWSEEAK